MDTVRLEVLNARKSVGSHSHSRTLWDGINLRISAGECVGVTGSSGCGKSTLLNCIGLLDSFDSGQLFIDGAELSEASARMRMRYRRKAIGYLFQDYALIDNDSVEQNILLAAPSGVSSRKTASSVAQALDAVGLAGRQRERVFQLSGGEQQRVAMARLLVRQPGIVLADEPTASLDRDNAGVILQHLHRLARGGAAIMIVSHDPWVTEQCDRLIRLDRDDEN